MRNITRILLALLSGILLSPAYFEWGSGFIIFIALVPLLFVEDDLYQQRKHKKWSAIIPYSIIAFMLFVALTVWWVKNSVFVGLIAALIVNTSFLTVPFVLFHVIKRNIGSRLGYLSLIVLWISFEYLFLNVQVNFPWILLGNAFANDIKFIQWYDATGALGGTLWVLLVNFAIFKLVKGFISKRSIRANLLKISWVLGLILFPIIISLVRFYTYEEESRPYNIVVLQPNIDPWEKFEIMPQAEQTRLLLESADELVDQNTDYIVGPETFINNSVWHHQMYRHPELLKIQDYLKKYPKAKFVIGSMTYKRYLPGDSISSTAKAVRDSSYFWDSFNTALQFDRTGKIQMYHKSILVTGAEWMPAFNKIKIMQKLAVDLGGITRSHGTQKERSVFVSPQDGLKVAPVICWESVFGEFVTTYVKKKGAEMIFIITNDGWWGDTPGYRQHNSYAHIRAIETRRSVARSANTGISCLINQRGEELIRTKYWTRDAISGTLNASDHLTFYVKHGDYIARAAAFVSVLLVLWTFVSSMLIRSEKKGTKRGTTSSK